MPAYFITESKYGEFLFFKLFVVTIRCCCANSETKICICIRNTNIEKKNH